jgi:hypothetical protein
MKIILSERRKLERRAQKLIETGRMPSLQELLAAITETKAKYTPLIREAQK